MSEIPVFDRHLPRDSTLTDVSAGPLPRKVRWGRRIGLTVLLVLVLMGASGFFGVHASTTSSSALGYRLTVTYPHTARAGLDIPWRVAVHSDTGFGDDVTIGITSSYFRLFETQGTYPDADSSRNNGQFVSLTFTKPPGHDFVLEFDMYVQPGAQLGKSATIRLTVGPRLVTSVHYRTWLVP